MNILLISDIHGNYVALEKVLTEMDGQFDQIYCLGDVIGYGPQPNECIDALKDRPNCLVISGNHDLAIAGDLSYENFNRAATHAVEWSKEQLTVENANWLASQPSILETDTGVTLVHASPRDPIHEYILNAFSAEENFALLKTALCFFGHTHSPILYENMDGIIIPTYSEIDTWIDLADRKLLINPGSVGQPRNLDPRAAYGLWNTESNQWMFKRSEYEIEKTQQLMKEAGLPQKLIDRLALGR